MRFFVSGAFFKSWTSIQRVNANELAALTNPSNSAPEKFLAFSANSGKRSTTSDVTRFESLILLVWILRICNRPLVSGKPISTCTSNLPGRNNASSIMSLRFVIPINNMLLSESTPSILDNS
eukprot:Pompholyxophrys_punicea_v1_NODE_620_length_1581_cov_2.434469.p2 type:complete len:122 gc:universal NODE_620_length_1581_cov_2.434469:1391-1026(-)